ncbi:MAG: ATP-binding protein, partial [Desulfobacula sp.]|nr:ATP-binding protein [Desulfobacula sp.]
DQSLSATYRATELVNQILTFSRKSEQKLIPLRIQSVIRDSLKLLRPSIPSTIQIKNSIDPKCENVIANPTQIHQVIMNLCTNAYHAMRETGGTLGISLQQIVITNEYLVDIIDLQPGHYLKLEVSDTGTGIPKDIQEKIFEPYFTTKTKEGGTGLGLAVVHGIVKSLHGDITINSEPGCGTKFHVFLPVSKTMGKMVLAKNTESIPTGIERILLVDDDKNLLQMNKKILQGLGYRVTAFMSSPEAFETFSKTPDSFDLVITDMTMPNITGAELAGQIFEINPDMPIILCTGYSELINPEKADSLGIQGYVSKPVLKRELANIIRKVLDKNKKN